MLNLLRGCKGVTTAGTKLSLRPYYLANSAPRPQAQSRRGNLGSAGPYRLDGGGGRGMSARAVLQGKLKRAHL